MENILEFNIANPYGGLVIKGSSGKYYWAVKNDAFDIIEWEEIPESLYIELVKFHELTRRKAK